MSLSGKKVLIALPPAMLEEVDRTAQAEHRTRSDLIREALRRYLHNFKKNQVLANMPPAPVQQSCQHHHGPVAVTQEPEVKQPAQGPSIPFFNR